MNIFDEVRRNPKYNTTRSAEWFMKNVRALAQERGIGPLKLLGDNVPHQTKYPSIGEMYAFTYDPKWKEKLPFYDTFPLVLPFSMEGKYFTGLNMHYLPPKTRLVLLTKLLEFANTDMFTPQTKLALTWKLLNNAARLPEVQPCVKKYIIGQVKSRFLKIPPADWINAIFLPVERFKKADAQEVWAKSRARMGGR